MYGQRGAFSLWDSTAFPDSTQTQQNPDEHTQHLQGLNITPILLERTHPNLITLHPDNGSPEVPMRSGSKQAEEDPAKHFNINTVDLTTSDIDSLLDRFQSLLAKSIKNNNIFDNLSPLQFKTETETTPTAKAIGTKSKTTHLSTDFTLPTLPPPSSTSASEVSLPSFSNAVEPSQFDPISFSCTLMPQNSTTYHDKSSESQHTEKGRTFSQKKDSRSLANSNKSNANKSRSPNIDPGKALMEVDQILERLQRLKKITDNNSQKRSSIASNSTREKVYSVESSQEATKVDKANDKSTHSTPPLTTTIELQAHAIGNSDDDSDTNTEYYAPPPLVESNMSRMNQTFNSHIFTEAKKSNPKAPNHPNPQQKQQIIVQSIENNEDLPPLISPTFSLSRSITSEEEICLDQMERDKNDLKRLHRDLLQFEKEYIAQHERRKAKRRSAASIPLHTEQHSTKLTETHQPASHSHAKHSQKSHYASTKSDKGVKAVVATDSRRLQTMEQTDDGHPAPPIDNIPRKSTITSTANSSSTKSQSKSAQSGGEQYKQNFHRNTRRVRFDHEHLAHRIDLISATNPTSSSSTTTTTLYQVERKERRCACCERHLTMNKPDRNGGHLDCLQMDRVRLDDADHLDGGSRRCKTVKSRRMANEQRNGNQEAHSNMDKSIQTSFIMAREDPMRSKSVLDGEYPSPKCANRGGSLPRTPPSNANISSSNRSLVYFVPLGTEEPKKTSNSGPPQQQSTATVRSNKRKSQQQLEIMGSNQMEVPLKSLPVAAHTLQDAFDRNCNQFKLRSLMRVRKIKDNEDLRKQTADQRTEEITQTYMMKKRIEDDRRQTDKKVSDTNSHNHPPPLHAPKSKVVSKKTIKVINNHDGYPHALPLITRRVFTHREMRAQTEKVYRKLPEVKAQSVNVKREDDARRRRMMADIFKQRLKENAIQGKLNWPITSQAITA